MYDLIIIGAGPAGMSAAVYAARAELDFIVIEGSMMQGGQVLTTYDVDNYLGLLGIGGFEMGMRFAEHAKKLGVSFVTENVISMDAAGEVKKVVTDKKEYEAKTIIIATGAVHRKAGIPGKQNLQEKVCPTVQHATAPFLGIRLQRLSEAVMLLWRMQYILQECVKKYILSIAGMSFVQQRAL